MRLIGDRGTLAFELQPLAPSWERRYLPEGAAWAALSIWVAGVNLCEHREEGTDQIQRGVNVPLGPLADWFVRAWPYLKFEERPRTFVGSEVPHENLGAWGDSPPAEGYDEDSWLEAREDWWSRHFVLAGGEGAFLPNLGLTRSHEKLVLDWTASRVELPGRPQWIREGGRRAVSWADAEAAVAQFVDHVAAWLRDEGLRTVYEWAGAPDPLGRSGEDPELLLELFTGRTASELSGLFGVVERQGLRPTLGLKEGDDPAASPVTQALRDLPPAVPHDVAEPLRWLSAQTGQGAPSEKLRALRRCAREAALGRPTDVEEGYAAATAVRRELGLDGEALPDMMPLWQSFGLACQEFACSPDAGHMVAGARDHAGAAVAVLRHDQTEASWARRFELARGLGHVLLDAYRGGAVGAASTPYCLGERRRRSGAFAAELLLPRDAIHRFAGGVLDGAARPGTFERIMQQFGTGAQATAYHLLNRRLLSSSAVRDELIDRFAARAG